MLLAAGPGRAQDLQGHGGPVRALAVLPGALASAGFDAAVILWAPDTGRAARVLRWHGAAVNALAALPDGGLASAGEDARVALWRPGLPGPTPDRVLTGATAPLTALAIGPAGEVAAAGFDGIVRVWTADGTMIAHAGHGAPVTALAWTAAGLVSAGYDGTLRQWFGDGGTVLAEFGLPQLALAALPGGSLAVAGADGAVRLRAPDGTVHDLAGTGGRPVVALAAAPDGRALAAASLDGAVTLWSLPAGTLRTRLDGPGLPVWSVAFAADGRTLWTGGQDRVVRRWDAFTGAPLGPIAATPEPIPAATEQPHGARVFRACAACHALGPEAPGLAGPHLGGLFGRRMGSVPGYDYSPRLAQGDIVWTPATVADLFTRGPDVVTPGTRMPVQTVGDPADLSALVRFLEAATGTERAVRRP